MLRDLRQLLLHDLGHLSTWHLQDEEEAEEDAANLELQLEGGHELEPVAEEEECLLLVLYHSQRRCVAIINGHGESLE